MRTCFWAGVREKKKKKKSSEDLGRNNDQNSSLGKEVQISQCSGLIGALKGALEDVTDCIGGIFAGWLMISPCFQSLVMLLS